MTINNRSIRGVAFALLGFTACLFSGCVGSGKTGSGTAASQTREVSSFTALRLDGAADVSASISDHTEVIVTTDDNLLPMVQTVVDGDTLVIRETENISPRTGVHVIIKTPSLSSVAINGAGDVSITALKESNLDLNLKGAGNISATGEADQVHLTVSGAGQANLADLASKDATVNLSGAGGAKVNSAATLNVTISGVGNVAYKGSPQVTQRVSGVGSVSRL